MCICVYVYIYIYIYIYTHIHTCMHSRPGAPLDDAETEHRYRPGEALAFPDNINNETTNIENRHIITLISNKQTHKLQTNDIYVYPVLSYIKYIHHI